MVMDLMRAVVLAALVRISWGQAILEGDEFKAMIDSGDFFAILDVRTKEEFDAGHIKGATLVESLSSFGTDQQVATPEDLQGCEDCTMAVYCQTGNRAAAAIAVLQDAGFAGDLFNGQGTIQWVSAGFDLVRDSSVEPSCVDNPSVSEECLRGPVANTNGNPFTIGSLDATSTALNDNATDQPGSWLALQNREPVSLVNVGSATNPWSNTRVDASSAATELESVNVGTSGNPWRVVPGGSWGTQASSSSNTDSEAEDSDTPGFSLSNRDPFNPSWITSNASRVSSKQNENNEGDATPSGATNFQWNGGGGTWGRSTDAGAEDSVQDTTALGGGNDPWNPSWASNIQVAASTPRQDTLSATSNTNSETVNNGGSTWVTGSTWDSEGRDSESTQSSSGDNTNGGTWDTDSSWVTSVSNSDNVERAPEADTSSTTSTTNSDTWVANSSWGTTTSTSSETSTETTETTSSNTEGESDSSTFWDTGGTWADSSATEGISATNGVIRPGSPDTPPTQTSPNSGTAGSSFNEVGSTWDINNGLSEPEIQSSEAREDSTITNFLSVTDWIQSNVVPAEPSENTGWGSWTGATNSNNADANASSRIGSDSPFHSGWTASSEQQQGNTATFIAFLGGPTSNASAPMFHWVALVVSVAVVVTTTFA